MTPWRWQPTAPLRFLNEEEEVARPASQQWYG